MTVEKKALDYCLWLLSRRSYPAKEIERKLRRKKYEPETIVKVLAQLKQWRYLDDAEYALAFVSERLRSKPRSRKLLLYELEGKGIERKTAREAVEKAVGNTGTTDEEQAGMALEKKPGYFRDGDRGKRRALNYLLRLGFSYETAQSAVKRFWNP